MGGNNQNLFSRLITELPPPPKKNVHNSRQIGVAFPVEKTGDTPERSRQMVTPASVKFEKKQNPQNRNFKHCMLNSILIKF